LKIGIPASTDVDATVERCTQLGVDTVFVSCASLPGYKERGYPDLNALRELKEGLEQRGIAVPSATYWFAKWPVRPWRDGSTNPDILLTRDRVCIDAMKRMIECLGEVGITSVLHYVDLGRPLDPADEVACWDGLIGICEELIPVAESYGIGIGNHSLHRLLADGVREKAVAAGVRIEDYDSYAAEGWGGPFLVGNWKELTRLVDAVPSPSNGVTLCTGMDIPGGDVPSLVRTFAEKIHFCQLRDHTDRWPEGREVLPGEGRVDLAGIVSALDDVGYTGIAHPEHLGKPTSPSEDRLAEAISTIRPLLETTSGGSLSA
jgi:sugar phosphate isomerase/epimerase